MTSFRPDQSRKAEWLSAMVAHELKNPLFAMRGIVDLLLGEGPGDLSAEQKRFLAAFKRNLDRLTSLVEGLLDMSRVSSGRIVIEPCWVDLDRFLDEVIESFGNLFNLGRVSIEKSVDAAVARIFADPGRLEQILVNLLSNAVRFVSEKGRVTLRAESGGKECLPADLRLLRWDALPRPRFCRFQVEDDGIGMSNETLAHLFTPYHGAGSTSRKGGTHLGLNISRELVRVQRGDMDVRSTLGIGTTVTFFLPADERTGYILECFDAMKRFLTRSLETRDTVSFFVAGKEGGECWLDLCQRWSSVPEIGAASLDPKGEGFYMWPLSEYLSAGLMAGEWANREPLYLFGSAPAGGSRRGGRFDGYAVGLASLPEDGARFEQLFNLSLGRMERELTGVLGQRGY